MVTLEIVQNLNVIISGRPVCSSECSSFSLSLSPCDRTKTSNKTAQTWLRWFLPFAERAPFQISQLAELRGTNLLSFLALIERREVSAFLTFYESFPSLFQVVWWFDRFKRSFSWRLFLVFFAPHPKGKRTSRFSKQRNQNISKVFLQSEVLGEVSVLDWGSSGRSFSRSLRRSFSRSFRACFAWTFRANENFAKTSALNSHDSAQQNRRNFREKTSWRGSAGARLPIKTAFSFCSSTTVACKSINYGRPYLTYSIGLYWWPWQVHQLLQGGLNPSSTPSFTENFQALTRSQGWTSNWTKIAAKQRKNAKRTNGSIFTRPGGG